MMQHSITLPKIVLESFARTLFSGSAGFSDHMNAPTISSFASDMPTSKKVSDFRAITREYFERNPNEVKTVVDMISTMGLVPRPPKSNIAFKSDMEGSTASAVERSTASAFKQEGKEATEEKSETITPAQLETLELGVGGQMFTEAELETLALGEAGPRPLSGSLGRRVRGASGGPRPLIDFGFTPQDEAVQAAIKFANAWKNKKDQNKRAVDKKILKTYLDGKRQKSDIDEILQGMPSSALDASRASPLTRLGSGEDDNEDIDEGDDDDEDDEHL